MKVTTPEERKAHSAFVVAEGTKGFLIGGLTALGIYGYVRRYHALTFKSFTPSVKAALLIMPTLSLCSFWAEEGSREFDMRMHSTEGGEEKLIAEYHDWKKKPLLEKIQYTASDNKYKLLFGLYGASFFAVQELSRGRTGMAAQNVARRNLAVGSTVVFLGLLTMMSKKDEPQDNEEWKKFLEK